MASELKVKIKIAWWFMYVYLPIFIFIAKFIVYYVDVDFEPNYDKMKYWLSKSVTVITTRN